MGACEICGKQTTLLKAVVSGTELEVCDACSKYGRVLTKPKAQQVPGRIGSANTLYSKPKARPQEPQLSVVADYASKIKKAREKTNMTHEDLSKKIAEKESMLHHIESGHHEPTIPVARKLEKFFGIRLVEEVEETKDAATELLKRKGGDGMTLGDFIKIKKR